MNEVTSRDFGNYKRVLFIRDSGGSEKKVQFNSLADLSSLEIKGLQGKVVTAKVYRTYNGNTFNFAVQHGLPYEEFANVKKMLNVHYEKPVKAVTEKRKSEKHIESNLEPKSKQTSEPSKIPEKLIFYDDNGEIVFGKENKKNRKDFELLERLLSHDCATGFPRAKLFSEIEEFARKKYGYPREGIVIAKGAGKLSGFYYLFGQK